MGKPVNCILISFHILLLLLFVHSNTAARSSNTQELTERIVQESNDPCANKDCGQGKCVNSSALGGFDCLCNPGWSKIQLGLLNLFPAACTIPNCTIKNECGNGAPPLPLPPPPAPVASPPPFNLFNPCNIVWCGDGTCVQNGLGYYCKCNEGSENFMNLTGVACLKECVLESDCFRVLLNPPQINSPPEAPGNAFGSPDSPPALANNGTRNVPNCSTTNCGHAMMFLIISLILVLSF